MGDPGAAELVREGRSVQVTFRRWSAAGCGDVQPGHVSASSENNKVVAVHWLHWLQGENNLYIFMKNPLNLFFSIANNRLVR